ncbi:alpha/beta hydrolase family protein [Thalassotalea aquiviva]|uniref:alpha/beta hydrolase family protein n=1 Tax=Thalassotalea aquiviva TaxID=3242415 RepID=UPI00352A9F6B
MKRFVALIVILLSSSCAVLAQQLPVDVFAKLPAKSLMTLSPNAERMAYRDTSDGKDMMVVIDLKQQKMVTAINVADVKPTAVYFVDNNTLIFRVMDNTRFLGYRDRHNVSVAYSFDIKRNEFQQLLLPGYGILHQAQTGLGHIVGLTPDKKYAFMTAYNKEVALDLFKVNLSKRPKPRIAKRGTLDTVDFFVGKDGIVLARERYNNDRNLHIVERNDDGDWVEIFKEETPYRIKGFEGITPDQKSLVMISQDDEHGRWSYYTMSLTDGSISEPIFSREDKDVERVIVDIHRVVHGVQYSGFTPSYEFFDKKLNARMAGIRKAMPNNTFTLTDYTQDWNNMVFYMEGEMSSGDYIMYQQGGLNLLASARPDIAPQLVNPTTVYSFKARDGLTIPSLMTLPVGNKAEKLPAILLPHGGPASYDTLSFDFLTQYFASQGYVVIRPQFRGSEGFGPEHLLAGDGEWGGKMQDDLTDAVNDLVAKGVVDKAKVCIVGASYGGYAALAGATFTPDMYQCAISINGVSDVNAMIVTRRKNYGSNSWVVAYWEKAIAKGDYNKVDLDDISPINHINKIQIPILLIHGERDKVVRFKQSEDMFDELEDADKEVTFVELEEGDHYLSSAKNRLKALQAIDKFIKKHI